MPPLHGSWGGERVRESEEGERRTARSNTYIHSDTYCSFESYSLLERFLETISSLLSSRGEILRPSGHLRRTARRSGTWETSSSAHRRTLRRVASRRIASRWRYRQWLSRISRMFAAPQRATRFDTRGVSRATILSSSSLLPFFSRIASWGNFLRISLSRICVYTYIYLFNFPRYLVASSPRK